MTKKKNAIDIENINWDLLKEKTADLPGLIEYAHSIGGFSIIPTEKGVIKSKAMNAMKEQTQDQLDIILEQMKTLANQAKKLQDRVTLSEIIYTAEMNFQPDIGQTYYVYLKNNGKTTLSLISPEEWGSSNGYEKCFAKVKLLSDHTFKVIEKYHDF